MFTEPLPLVKHGEDILLGPSPRHPRMYTSHPTHLTLTTSNLWALSRLLDHKAYTSVGPAAIRAAIAGEVIAELAVEMDTSKE